MSARSAQLLYEGADWDFATLQRIYEACEDVAVGQLGLDTYPNQIEVITAEQMLDAYASNGMPILYRHWSYGKHFLHHDASYQRGWQELAYEIVINSSPCISYLMESNTATLQALVIAHAAFGHNHFFKNNYQFKLWTDADGILDYLDFAKKYVADCEERYGQLEVERTLDAAHALMPNSTPRFAGRKVLNLRAEEQRQRERRAHEEAVFNDLWRTVPRSPGIGTDGAATERRRSRLGLPQDNILYFLEKSAPRLPTWKRELLRIVRNLAQYFYPQAQTKLMNEGAATYVHYAIMNRLYDSGRIGEGSYLEFLRSHSNVVYQPAYDEPQFGGFNPYALGFAMMREIERVVKEPTAEDREWFPDIAGKADVMGVLRDVWANYRDESFVAQFLSPRLMRQMRLFAVCDDPGRAEGVEVTAIHDERGYRRIRRQIAREYDPAWTGPDIEIVDVDLEGDRRLIVRHSVHSGVLLDEGAARHTLQHLADLWTYAVLLQEADSSGSVLKEYNAAPQAALTG